jgi:sulfite reductase (NADPH) flavoprotein alpha-component
MLGATKLKMVLDLVQNSTREELIWINGYLAAVAANGQQRTVPAEMETANAKPLVNKITIAYGTESGNSKKLASTFAAEAKSKGIQPKVVSLDQYRVNDIAKEEYFLAIISTQGDGEPPAAAKKFYDHIHNNGFKAEKLKYSVLALGDTSYPLFCKAGEDVDAQLNKLGGQRIHDLIKCDTDFEDDAKGWFNGVLNKLSGTAAPEAAQVATPKKKAGKQTYAGEILASVNLNDVDSNKETFHIEIGAEEVSYLPGDSLGLVPHNDKAIVAQILDLLQVDELAEVNYKDQTYAAEVLFRQTVNINFLAERTVKKYAELVKQEIPAANFCLLDLLKIYSFPAHLNVQELVDILDPIAPRLYSISSSPEAHNGEIHLTVSRNCFKVNDEQKYGLCSNYLAQLPVGSEISYYIHPNNRFRLPSEEKDVIMIGPGTGIAPFRSFLAERDATGASGRNWLFFGEQHFASDFLYQTEIQNWFETGVLNKVNVAFSRDQKEKIYVQHKMLEQGKELFNWLESGACIYLCGTKDPMSVDVENALVQIVAEHGQLSEEAARQYVLDLENQDRYLKDVY